MSWRKGDLVTATCKGQTVAAEIVLASPNGRSLALYFDAILDGHVQLMPVVLDDDGVYRVVVTGNQVTLSMRN